MHLMHIELHLIVTVMDFQIHQLQKQSFSLLKINQINEHALPNDQIIQKIIISSKF